MNYPVLRDSELKLRNLQPVDVCRATQPYLQDAQLKTKPSLTALCFLIQLYYNLPHD